MTPKKDFLVSPGTFQKVVLLPKNTLDEFFHLVFLLLNTYFNSHMRYSNLFLLNNIKLCLYDAEKRFRNGRPVAQDVARYRR